MSEYYVWMQQVLGYANQAVSRVIAVYGTAKAFYDAPDSEKIAKCRLSKQQVSRLHNIPRKKIYNILNESAKSGINIITPEDDKYPKRLLNIPDPPAVLYCKGEFINTDDLPVITIVGPRKISEYGDKCAYVISNTLSSCGFTVVSGGAVGGDKSAHLGALDAGAKTIAVLGAGINYDYLKCNADLRERISKSGFLISEYPPSERLLKGAFQQRNRILSGLSNGVVVVEGGKGSGTLITAKYAAEQGRDVFVIPGSPSLPQYEGSNRLLFEGAKPLLSINDIVEEYIHLYPDVIHQPQLSLNMPSMSDVDIKGVEKVDSSTVKKEKKPVVLKSQVENPKNSFTDDSLLSQSTKTVFDVIKTKFSNKDFTADDLAETANIEIGEILGSLTELEIFGAISPSAGGRFTLN